MKFKFRTLVNKYEQQVYSLALHMLQRPEEAEDVTQDVYVKLWRNIEHIDSEQAKHWLLKVTRNACIDRIRVSKVEEDVDQFEFENENKKFQPAEALNNSRLSQWLKNAIYALEEPYRSLIVMNDIQQKTQREIAQIMDLNSNQVKVYVHRARQQLRTRLQGVIL